MGYYDTPDKKVKISEDRNNGFSGHDMLLEDAQKAGKFGTRTDANAQGVGYVGMDDIDRMRRTDWTRT